MQSKLLLVDDETFVLTVLSRVLSDEPCEIHIATSGEEALDIMKTHSFKVVISDECMRGMLGTEFLSKVRERFPETVRILLTGHATLEAAMKAVNQGEIYRFFTKPWNDTEILFAVRSAIEKYDLECENRRLLHTLKRQSFEMMVLEHRFPGISQIEKDKQGNIVLDDMQESEIQSMIQLCEREIRQKLESD